MNWFNLYVGSALAMVLIAAVLWFHLLHKVRPWLWWIVQLSLIVFLFHAGGHFFPSDTWITVTHSSAVVNAALVLLAVIMARRGIRRNEELENLVVTKTKAIESEHSAALQLTHLLNDYKVKIQYYEDQAARSGLPLFK